MHEWVLLRFAIVFLVFVVLFAAVFAARIRDARRESPDTNGLEARSPPVMRSAGQLSTNTNG